MGAITPLAEINVFVIKWIAPKISLETVFKRILPILAALIIVTMILIIFPGIATFLTFLQLLAKRPDVAERCNSKDADVILLNLKLSIWKPGAHK